MSGLILPDYDAPAFVQGRRLKRIEYLEDYIGWVVRLRHPSLGNGKTFSMMTAKTNTVGILTAFVPAGIDPKRAAEVVFLSAIAAALMPVPAQVIELCGPWAHPPGFPEKAVSLLEE